VATIRIILPAELPKGAGMKPSDWIAGPLPVPDGNITDRRPFVRLLTRLIGRCLCPRFGDRLDGSVTL
jgi:hypothetical protein